MNLFAKKFGSALVAMGLVAVSCEGAISTPEELAAAQTRALELGRPLVLLVMETGHGRADDTARKAIKSVDKTAVAAVMDLSVSRARATADRFQVVETPVLFCFSPRGVLISRDKEAITKSLILERIREAANKAAELDEQLVRLEGKKGPGGQLELGEFWMAHQNNFEAIPVLAGIAHSQTGDVASRIRAWAELAVAYFGVAQPEKGRHEAQDLIATLGATNPEAKAAGYYVIGAHDAANPLRPAKARTELEAAIAAAPKSSYAVKAGEALKSLR